MTAVTCPKCIELNSLFAAFEDDHEVVADKTCTVCGGSGIAPTQPAQLEPTNHLPEHSTPAQLRGRAAEGRRETVGQKATRLKTAARATALGRDKYYVVGDHGEYRVTFSATGATCECPSTVLCSHIIAAALTAAELRATEQPVGGHRRGPVRFSEAS